MKQLTTASSWPTLALTHKWLHVPSDNLLFQVHSWFLFSCESGIAERQGTERAQTSSNKVGVGRGIMHMEWCQASWNLELRGTKKATYSHL